MASNRGYSHPRRFIPRRQSILTVALFTTLAFVSSIFLLLYGFAPKEDDMLKDDTRLEEPLQSQSAQQQVSDENLWGASRSHGLHPCIKPTVRHKAAQGSDHYITVKSNGGLNQMRTGISDMVAVAFIMNATLVIPQLDKRSFWQDTSTFSDIFDELHFITTLQDDVRIVKALPKELESFPRARKHFTSWSGMGYYEEMARLWKDYQVIHVAKSDSRLANNDLPLDIQRLRCRALYHALRFSPSIESLGKVLRMHDDDTTEAGGASEITRWKIHCSPSEI